MTILIRRIAKSARRRSGLTLLTILVIGAVSGAAVYAAANKPAFTLSTSPGGQSIYPADSTSYTVTVQRQSSYTGGVTLSVSGAPAGATATLSPTSIPAGSSTSTLTVTTTGATPSGNYSLTITGTGTGSAGTQTTTASLSIQQAAFTISNPSGGIHLDHLGSPAVPLNLVITNPFNQPLSLSSITVSVTSTSKSGCPASDFQINQTAANVSIPKNTSTSLTALGAQLPTITWLNRPYPQNSCFGAALNFSYSATGTRTPPGQS
jgi:hypothetical protein